MPKNVIVTGGAGFIAHHVIEYLLDNTDWNIYCLDRIDTAGNLNRLSDIINARFKSDGKRVKIIYHDLRAEINQQIADMLGDINIILHLAAASHVTRSIQYPMEFVQSNVVGTVNLLEYARKLNNLERFVYFSTDEVFGPAIGNYTFTEYDRYNATNPYSASKAGGEEMCVAYQNTYKLPLYITHTMNVYGERQAPEKYVPMCIKKLLNGETLKIHYSKYSGKYGSRNYLYAKDVASALMFILNLNAIPKHHDFKAGRCPKFNISAGKEYDNMQIAKILSESLEVNMIYEDFDPNIDRPGHDFSYAISGEYLRSIGWSPQYSVEETMPQVAKWYRNNSHWLK